MKLSSTLYTIDGLNIVARGKFFEEVIPSNDYVHVAGKNMFVRDYYHPEEEQSDEISSFISFSDEEKVPLPEEFMQDIGYLEQYKANNSSLIDMAKTIRQF